MNISLSPELARLIEEKIKTGRYQSADEVIQDALRLLEEKGATPNASALTAVRAAEIARQIAKEIPDEVWDRMPADFSKNIDHYLYGLKRED